MSTDAFVAAQLDYPDDPIEVVVNEVFEPAGEELDALVETKLRHIKTSGTRIWVVNSYASNARKIIKLALKLGITGEGYQVFIGGGIGDCVLYNPQCPGPNGETTETDPDLTEAVHGAIFTLPYVPTSSTAYSAFQSKMVSLLSLSSPSEVNTYSPYVYEAVYVYAYALDTFPDDMSIHTEKEEFMKHLRGMVVPGVLGPVSFDANGDRASGLNILNYDYGSNGAVSNSLWSAPYRWDDVNNLQASDGVTMVWSGGQPSMPTEDVLASFTGEENGGVAMAVIFGIVGGAVAIVLIIVAITLTKEKKLKKEKMALVIETLRGEDARIALTEENFKLKNDVAIMQDYNKAEVVMLEEQIKKFTQDMSATGGVHKDMEKLLIKAEELVGKVVIGAGAHGEVYKSDYRGTAVAVKTMKQVDEVSLEGFQGEIMLMSGLRHQNVVTMLGCCWEKDLMALVMEYCEKGTSTDVLKAEGDHLTWDDPLLKWLLDVSRGMNYLHGMTYYDADKKEQVRGIIHRDLKPDNCLVTETWGVKVADFGEARAVLEDAIMTQVGTPIYVAPEVVKGEYYTEKADVFSFAMTILQFCLKNKPLLEYLKDEYKTHKKREPTLGRVSLEVVVRGWRPNIEGIEGAPRCVIDLLSMCWEDCPDARPTFGEIVGYAQAELLNEVMGAEGGGTEGKGSHRTSTSGGLAMRIDVAKGKKAEEEAVKEKGVDVAKEKEEASELDIWKNRCEELKSRCEELEEELKESKEGD